MGGDIIVGSGVTISPDGDIFATGITTVGGLTVNGDLSVSGDISYDEVTGRNLNVSGIATVGFITSSNAFYTGVVTATTFSGNLSGNVTGDVTGTASKASTVSLTDESSDTTCFPTFATSATGDQALQTGTNLTFNSNTGDLAFTSATISDHTTVGSAVTSSESGIDVTGIVTATSYRGDGSQLTGVGSTDNIRTNTNATFLQNVNVSGTVTATSYIGDGSSLTGVANTENIRTNTNATFLQNVNVSGSTTTGSLLVGSGVTISSTGDMFNTGITTNAKQIVGLATNNVIPFLYSNYSDLPSAVTYHGAFAHVHGAGKAYFAHAAAWYELVHVDNASHTVGLGTEKYNVGILTATSIKVGTGVTLSSDGDSFVTGVSTATKFVGNLSDAVIGRWSVTNNGSSAYRFTGPGGLDGSEDNSTIYVARGQTYEFNVNASGHPFQIRQSAGGSAYSTGVTNNGAQSGVVKFEVPFSAPAQLVYQCTNHSGMVGILSVFPAT
tara:strand:- start:4 stop:1494 length:1491 start_codon:yes stop_codon:yes gene_type:complete